MRERAPEAFAPARRFGLRRMQARDPREPGRTASSLELFFDLTFVICVSVATDHLLLREEERDWGGGIASFAVVFFAIWWAWTTVTWFGSAYETDDWLYRAMTFVQMGGVLVLAAGIAPAFDHGDFRLLVGAWVVMRLALVAQWVRSARGDEHRRASLRAAAGSAALQVAWVVWAQIAPFSSPTWAIAGLALIGLELLVPVWANRGLGLRWHPHHLVERHSLFTLIVLGAGLLTSARAMLALRTTDAHDDERVILFGATAFVIIAALWWIYFSRDIAGWLSSARRLFAFGYLHYLVFASAAAVAAGLQLAVAGAADELHLHLSMADRAATTIPVALFVLATWAAVLRRTVRPWTRRTIPVIVAALALSALVPFGEQVCALLTVATVVILEVDARRGTSPETVP